MDSPLKRFTNTGKWNDPWFRSLAPTTKLLWSWLVDHCDNAGVIEPDIALAGFQIGSAIEEKHLTELGDRLQRLPSGKLWIPKYIRFQFGELTSSSQVHCSVIKLIRFHNLDYPIPSISDVNGMRETSDTTKDKRKDKVKKKEKSKATLDEVRLCCAKAGLPESDADWFFNKCEGNGWTNAGRPIQSWPHVISAWKAAGYMPSQKHQHINGDHSSKPKSVFELKTQREAKETLAKSIRDKFYSEAAMGGTWSNLEKQKEWGKLRSEIKFINETISKA